MEYLKSASVGLLTAAIDFLLTGVILFIANAPAYGGNFIGVFGSGGVYNPFSVVVTATLIGFSTAFLINYVLSVFFVYEYGNVGKNKNGFIKFLIFALCGMVMTVLGTFIGVSVLKGNIWLVKIIVTAIVFIFNMFTRKRLIFNIEIIMDEDTTIHL